MKKLFVTSLVLLFIIGTAIQLNAQDWLIYDASVLPTATGSGGDTLDLTNLADNSPGPGLVEEIIDDPDIIGNKLFKYLHPDGKRMYRHYFDEAYTDTAFTMIARVRGEHDPAYDRVFDLQWHNGNAGTRDELRIWGADSTFELEKVNQTVKVDADLYAWHTIRIAVYGDLSTIYVDENPTPVISGISTEATTAKYIKVGDGSGEAIGGYMDWCILNPGGAFGPGEGPDIPEGLFVDGKEEPIPEPDWLVYDGSVLPTETGSSGDTLDLKNLADNSPGPGLVAEILDDPDIAGNKIFKYLHPDGKLMYRYYFDDAYADSEFTMIARVRGENDSTFDRVFDLQWHNGVAGTREELRIWGADSTFELEKVDQMVKVDADLYSWHTIRVVVKGDLSTVYIDEDPIPVISGVSASGTTAKYIKVGDGSGEAIGGYMDWCILSLKGAFAPGEGPTIPEGLIVDKKEEPVEPDWLVYDASVLPTETGSGGDTLDLSNLADNSPGPGLVAEILDDPDIAGNKIFKYLHPDGKLMYRHYFDEAYADSQFTLIARVRGENDTTYDRIFDLQWHNGNAGTREELRIWGADSTFELEKLNQSVKLDVDLFSWHTIRIAVNGDYSTVYLDENTDPIISGLTTSATDANYIKVGDGSGETIGGYMDWCILSLKGAFAPGEGPAIPEGLFIDTGEQPVVPKWLVYDANILPSETGSEGDSLDLTNVSDNSPGPGLVEEIIDDPDIAGNKLLKYLHPDGKKMYRHNFYEDYEDSSLTMMARIKGENDPIYDRPFDLQWRNGNANSRDELRIWPADSTIELEKAGVELKVDMDLYGWHTYRIAVSGDLATIYIDEDVEPVISGVSLEANSDKYLKVGDGSGDAIGGYLDWLILDTSGAFAPGEGLAIPAGLYVDKKVEPLKPKWMVYDASILPSETGGGGDSLDLSGLSQDAPGAGFVEEIVDDPDISGNKVLKYLQPSGTKMYRYSFDDTYTGTSLTMIARIKGDADPTYDRIFDLQWRNANVKSRDELRIWGAEKKLELEKANVEVIVEFDPLDWHTYRIAVDGDSAAVYVDENPVPVIYGVSTESNSDNYIKIGDGSGDAIGGYLDWCIVDMSGAYAPGEGLPIPEHLFVDTLVTKVQPIAARSVPITYELEQNYPNPFNPATTIQFQLPKSGHVKLSVYDVTGRLVATLIDEKMEIGRYSVSFDAQHVASGIYFYKIETAEFNDVKKMLLIK